MKSFPYLLFLIILLLSGCTTTTVSLSDTSLPTLVPTSTVNVEDEKVDNPIALQHPVSLPVLFEKEFNGSDLTLHRVLERTDAYTRHYITYKSGDLTISGIMNIPHGDGPFPVLILNHGHIDTSIYTNGRGLRREQDYLARQGFAILHPDYRNHAQSSKDTRDELAVRLSYAEDVINAVHAVKRSGLAVLDTNRIGMLGHSMGGGVTLATLVVDPGLVQAAVLYAPVSGDMSKSYERWMSRRPETAAKITALYGSPTTSLDFWQNVSSENFYERVTAPVAIFHGTADDSVPLAWSEETKQLLETAGKDVSLTIYPGGPHEFARDWPAFMGTVATFFKDRL